MITPEGERLQAELALSVSFQCYALPLDERLPFLARVFRGYADALQRQRPDFTFDQRADATLVFVRRVIRQLDGFAVVRSGTVALPAGRA